MKKIITLTSSVFIFIFTLLPSSVESFTNGTLLPSYLCGNQGDGYPKSVGSFIPYLQLGTILDPYNEFPAQISSPPSAQLIIGAFHNGNPNTGYITPIDNPIVIVPTYFTDLNTGIVDTTFAFKEGTAYSLSIVVNYPTFNPQNGIALDGAFVYALDSATNQRIGIFTNSGPNMTPWYACNLNGKYPIGTGIVHNSLLSENAIYSGIVWQAPDHLSGNVVFIGAGVTDNGFGPFKVTYNTLKNNDSNIITNFEHYILFLVFYILYISMYSISLIFKEKLYWIFNYYNSSIKYVSNGVIIFLSIYTILWSVVYFYIYTLNDLTTIFNVLGQWITLNISMILVKPSMHTVLFKHVSYYNMVLINKYISILCMSSIIIKIVSVFILLSYNTFISTLGYIMATTSCFLTIAFCIYSLFPNCNMVVNIIFILAIIIVQSFHSIVSLYYCIPALTIIILDFILIHIFTNKSIHTQLVRRWETKFTNEGVFINITLLNSVKKIEPGSYFYLCFKDISRFEWYPVSILLVSEYDNIQFYIRKSDDNTWKNKINNIDRFKHEVYLRGPYKNLNLDYSKKNNLLFLSIGSGVIPQFSIISDIIKKQELTTFKNIYFVWIVNNAKFVQQPYENILHEINKESIIDLKIYVINKDNEEIEGDMQLPDYDIEFEKPNISKLIQNYIIDNNLLSIETACIGSGPRSFCENIISACEKLNIEVTTETL